MVVDPYGAENQRQGRLRKQLVANEFGGWVLRIPSIEMTHHLAMLATASVKTVSS